MASVLKDESCPLCSNPYSSTSNIPRVLRCLDVFCQPCLEKSCDKDGSQLACPKCTEVTQLDKNGVHGLSQDYATLQAKQLLSVQGTGNDIPCHECPDDASATFFCKDCSEYQCQTCRNLHLDIRSKLTRKHCVIWLQDVTQEVIKATLKPVKCPEHDQPLRYYCDKEECKLPICGECMAFEHQKQEGHQIRKLGEALQSSKDRIKARAERAKEEYTLLVRREENERKCKLMMEKQKGTVLNEIQEEFDRLAGVIKERKQKLEEELERRYATVSDEIQCRLGNIMKEQKKRLQAQTFAKAALDHCTDVDFLTIDRTINDRFETLTQGFPTKQPIHGYKLDYASKLPSYIAKTLSTTDSCISMGADIISSVKITTMSAVQNQRSKVADISFEDKDGKRFVVAMEDVRVTASVDKEEPIKCELEIADGKKLYQAYLTAGLPGEYLISAEVHGQRVEGQDYFVQVQSEEEYEEELASEESCAQNDSMVTTGKDTVVSQLARSDAQINTTRLDSASTAQPVKRLKPSCPTFAIDKDTVYREIQVSNDGRTISHPRGIQRGKAQLNTYEGGKGTRSFDSNTKGKVQYRVRIDYKIFQQLEEALAVFEIGLSTDECIDKEMGVGYQPNAHSFLAVSCVQHSSVCCRLMTYGKKVFHSRLSDNTAGTHVDVTYNFLFDTKKKKWTVKDHNNETICVATHVSLGQHLWPVFGIYAPGWLHTTLQLLSTEGLPFTIDKDTVHRRIQVSDDGRTLSLVDSTLRGDRQLKQYKGGRGTISFTGGTVKLSAYFQVRVNYRIKQQLGGTALVFEVGLCRQEHIDKSEYVGSQPHAISFHSINCVKHTGVCMFVYKAGSSVFHSRLSNNTAGTEVDVTYGFLMDVEKRTWTVVDCGNNTVLCVVKDVNLDQPLWPVFGIYCPDHLDVTMTLITGDSIQSLPSCISI